MAAYIYLPSSYFRKSDNPIGNDDTEINILSYKKEDLLWVKDKMLQGTDKRFVVTLAKYTVSSWLDYDRTSFNASPVFIHNSVCFARVLQLTPPLLHKKKHTWRIFPLPIRSHGLMSQHTIKESLNLIGTFQLDGGFGIYRFKNGRGM